MSKTRFLLILSFLFLTSTCSAQDDTLKVLFLGNSYTIYNAMPSLFQSLSGSAGKTVIQECNAPGGYWLEDHKVDATSLDLISRTTWDYVVLQEQSQVPTIDYYRDTSMYPSARQLDNLIESNSSQTCLFMTWGRKYGGQQTIGPYSSPPFADFYEMQASLSLAYSNLADSLAATLAPVGDAWAAAVTQDPDVNLWQTDNSHPTLQGSYLAACVFFATLFNQSPVGLNYNAGLDPDTALFLQQIAEETVLAVNETPPNSTSSFEYVEQYPNPFNSTTIIGYTLPRPTRVELCIYDIQGCRLKTLTDDFKMAGVYQETWDAKDRSGLTVGSGVYFYELHTDAYSHSGRLLFLK